MFTVKIGNENYKSRALELNPVGLWMLGDYSGTTAVDDSPNGHNGTYSGVTLGAAGTLPNDGTAASFDGTNDNVTVAHHADFNLTGTRAVTVSAWIKPQWNATGSTYAGILCKYAATAGFDFGYRDATSEGRMFIWARTPAGSFGFESANATLQEDVWQHVVGVLTDTSAAIYIDGVLANSNTFAATLTDDSGSLTIGSRDASLYAEATMQGVAYYDYALTAEEIAYLYEAGAIDIRDFSQYFTIGGFAINDMAEERNTANLEIVAPATRVLKDDGASITLQENGNTFFSGYITGGKRTNIPGTNRLRHMLDCIDQNRLADRRVYAGKFTSKSAAAILADMIDAKLKADGVSAGYDWATLQDPDIAAYWPMGESGGNLVDATGGGNDMAPEGAPTYGEETMLYADPGKSVLLDGSNDNFTAAYDAAMNADEFTIEFWARTDDIAGTGVIWSNRIFSDYGCLVMRNGTQVLFRSYYIGGGGSGHAYQTTGAPFASTSDIVHVVCTYDGTTMRIHINGVEDVYGAGSHDKNTSADTDIGSTGTTNRFEGNLERVAYYNVAKTEAWAAARYALGTTGVGGSLKDTFTIDTYISNYDTIAANANRLAEITAYLWYIDYDKVFHFRERDDNAASFGIDENAADVNILAEASRERPQENYRNTQIIRGGLDVTDPLTETFLGDGETKTFVVSRPVNAAPTIEVNAVSKTVGILDVDTGKDWYWNKGINEIVQDEGGTTLTSSDTLEVVYEGQIPIVLVSQDEAEVLRRAALDGTSGVVENVVEETDIEGRDMAVERADGLIARYGRVPKKITFSMSTTSEANLMTLRSGQSIVVNLPTLDVNDTYLVESVKWKANTANHLVAEVVAVDGLAQRSWVEYFRKLADRSRGKQQLDSEVIILMQQATETVSLTDSIATASRAAGCFAIGDEDMKTGYFYICD